MVALLLWAWFAGVGSPTREAPSARQAVVWLLTDTPDDAVVRGARMGAEEMTRTSTLLGANFVLRVFTQSAVDTRQAITGTAFVVFDLADDQACGAAKAFANARGVIVMTARVSGAECGAPVLSLRFPQPRRRVILERAGARGGGDRVEEWDPALQRFGAQELNERYTRREHAPMSSDAWAGWFATKVALEATLRMDAVSRQGLLAADAPTFDGHKGVPLRFDPSGILQQPVYIVDGSGKVIKEVP